MRFDFSSDVRNALAEARNEAARLGHTRVDGGHLLLGLLASGDTTTVRLLDRCDIPADEVRQAVEAAVPGGARRIALAGLGELPYTVAAKETLEATMACAMAERDSTVTSVHLLLALVQEDRSVAGTVLRQFGITPETVRSGGPEAAEPGGFRVRIDDASDLSIYEQIVAQVQEGIATGALAPGRRLPPVRSLADRLGIAPGTVARAYSELERLGAVVTQGARGTRVAARRTPTTAVPDRAGALAGLLRPVAVAAFHMGATAAELREALETAMRDILGDERGSAA